MLSWVSGLRIPVSDNVRQHRIPVNKPQSEKHIIDMNKEITHLVNLGAIKQCLPCNDQFCSGIFLTEKSNGKKRFILNLKELNKFVSAPHFKLEDYRTAMRLISKDAYMCSIDLKDAYFSVSIHNDYKKYLRFMWQDKLWEFQVLAFGLNIAPYIFTKLMRPVMQYLRSKGIMSVIYLDDLLLLSHSREDCKSDFIFTRNMLESLGFTINLEKSVSTPSKQIAFLGFVFDSDNLTISIPGSKKFKIKEELLRFSKLKRCRLRNFAHLIGLLISICPAIKYGWLHTKYFERTKFLCLKQRDDYDQYISLPNSLSEDFSWWLSNIDTCSAPVRFGQYSLEIYSDASRTGWGISCADQTASGRWSQDELVHHINYLELQAAFFGLKIFAKDLSNCEILLRIDNTTAISYINRMGGIQFPHLNSLSRRIWQWCEQRDIFIFASYISSTDNYIADQESRRINIDVEWELTDKAFSKICRFFGHPEIDLFASRLNKKCHRFVSWHRDPEAFAIDAFTLSWSDCYFYIFSPFCLILRVLQKIVNDKGEGIVIVPLWPSQPWYPLYKKLLISDTIIFSPDQKWLSSPYSSEHKLQQKLTLVAGLLSGRRLSTKAAPPRPQT